MAAKSNLKNMALSLTLVCLVCSAILGCVYAVTSDPIKEAEQAKTDMGKMLDYIDKLGELDTSNVEPMSHAFKVQNVFREDEVINGDDRENILKNAPEEKDGMFVVPKTF